MALAAGARLGPYEILSAVAEGERVSENGPYVESRKDGPLNAGYRPSKADAACRLDAREMSTFPLAAGSAVS